MSLLSHFRITPKIMALVLTLNALALAVAAIGMFALSNVVADANRASLPENARRRPPASRRR